MSDRPIVYELSKLPLLALLHGELRDSRGEPVPVFVAVNLGPSLRREIIRLANRAYRAKGRKAQSAGGIISVSLREDKE